MTRQAFYSISIDGNPVTANFAPHILTMTIKDSDGGKSDTLEITLDDAEGAIVFPRTGATVTASIGWVGGGSVSFEGKTDEPKSTGGRGQGMILSISAHSADMKGKAKEKKQKHKDDAAFSDVASEWGKDAGISVSVDPSLGSIKRAYWALANESFLSWGARIADEIGATFKVSGSKAVFVPMNSGKSASGKELATVYATRPGNIISWSLSPNIARGRYKKSTVRWYDEKEAKWKSKEVEIGDDGAEAALVETVAAANADRAGDRAKANAEGSKRDKGGGSISIDGEPSAKAQAPLIASGIRDGIDGEYRITTASHTYTRGGGYVTSCEVEQPKGSAGSDGRKGSNGGSGSPASTASQQGAMITADPYATP